LQSTELTKGNLSTHLSKLEEANYVAIEKGFRGKIPMTVVRLTRSGSTALENYRREMTAMLKPRLAANREANLRVLRTPSR